MKIDLKTNSDRMWDTRRRRVDIAWVSGMVYLIYVTARADFTPPGMIALATLITPILLYIGGIISFYIGTVGAERIGGVGGQTVTTTTTVAPPTVTSKIKTEPLPSTDIDEVRPPHGGMG